VKRLGVIIAIGVILAAALQVLLTQVSGDRKSVADRVKQFGQAVRARLMPAFDKVGVPYPPKGVILVGLKQERLLEVWVSANEGGYELLRTYSILGASGGLGPKLTEGDLQVPEGIYCIESLNPNSKYHLALRLNYPNEFDRAKARIDGRSNPGGDIMIHGKNCSFGCLAMGDEAAEDLFVLASETGIGNISVILSPIDFRVHSLPSNLPLLLPWTPELYRNIKENLVKLRK
jgi:murein L,D-transpeptidase YafK